MSNTELIQRIKLLARETRDEVIAIRHHIHSHPELSFEEKETAAFISNKLSEWGMDHQTNIGGYGIVGLIKSSAVNPQLPIKKVVALRADTDALPIQEKNTVP